ncbi:hypothetical protein AB0D86_48440 [Streptomyces sp. NPDC048324]|uniref:hypothetical protein n=1 Tax=Streptomyces sp. NPDC048324 TaxID=3157205 RepID=UPI003447CDD4
MGPPLRARCGDLADDDVGDSLSLRSSDAIRRTFGDDVPSVPSFNDAHGTSRTPLRMVDQAAGLADARGL